jgi:excisionase family DNA binding protein
MQSTAHEGDTLESTRASSTTDLHSVQETAQHYGVKRSWLYQHVASKTIPYFKVGKYLRFDWNALDALFAVETHT